MHCSLFFCPASFLFLKIRCQFPALFIRMQFPEVTMPPSHLSPIDSRQASALQGVWKLLKEGSWDRFRGQGMLKLKATTLWERWDYALSLGPIYFSVSLLKDKECYCCFKSFFRPVFDLFSLSFIIDLPVGMVVGCLFYEAEPLSCISLGLTEQSL